MTRLRGTIIKTPDGNPGLLVADGQQKTFTLEGTWKSQAAPAVDMAVDIELDGAGFITRLTAVDPHQAAREKLEQMGGAAQEKARQGIGALVARMGRVALVATVTLWIAWFFLPGLSFSLSFIGLGRSRSVTLWDALALDLNNKPLDPNNSSGGHGFLSLVVLVGIAAPLSASFIWRKSARYFYAAPLACLLVAWLTIQLEFDHLLYPMRQQYGNMADGALKMSPTTEPTWSCLRALSLVLASSGARQAMTSEPLPRHAPVGASLRETGFVRTAERD